ncbi:glycosyltransferase [Halobacterium salinarum]|uniref:glycosyltransferase family 2 protein n=1 Tax=Halobacterium salinarum TaxID=2242 RepID=UPI0025531511|nr:glycosyltransferase family 2 protein [Halobacterium salinarum]MDL0118516.1 glycosyltransferase [Halobacterium salinarum]MDL0118729.1 glycosyltransferase [Halobacterium salinarum]MDL0118759.1 glycosyltransferase [Halobacterium salinarum]
MSVVLPTYNRPNRLKKAVRTVDNQSYKNIELIVVDDHSKRPAEATINEISIENIREVECIRFEENRGANAARNRGIEESNGEYIAFLDDDDEWEKKKVEEQVKAFQNDDDLGLVFTGICQKGSGGIKSETRPDVHGDLTKDLLTGGPMSPFSAIMVRRDIITQVGKPDENLPSLQDREWAIRLSRKCDFASIPDPLTIHRIGYNDQKAYDYEKKRDVSIPYIINKHQDLARNFGIITELKMRSWLNYDLATTAMAAGYYIEARKLFLKSIFYNPLRFKNYLLLLVVLFGEHSYKFSKKINEGLGGIGP